MVVFCYFGRRPGYYIYICNAIACGFHEISVAYLAAQKSPLHGSLQLVFVKLDNSILGIEGSNGADVSHPLPGHHAGPRLCRSNVS